MDLKRRFIIEIFYGDILDGYLSKINKLSAGYYYNITKKIEKSKIWKLSKTCQNAIDNIEKYKDPTKFSIKRLTLKSLEITDNQTIRNIKLKKIKFL